MADVDGNLKDWSTTEASNKPSGSTTIGTGLDDNLRAIQKVVRQDLATKGSDVASTGSMDVGAVAGLMHDITGTTTVTGLGTVSSGIWKVLKFEGAVPLIHNATSLILPGAANITTADGDVGIFMSEGSGNWRCLHYMRAAKIPPADRPVVGSAIATTSGTSVTISTAIPSWAKRLTLLFNGVSLSGTSDVLVQIGPSGGVESTGYVAESALTPNAGATAVVSSTAGFIVRLGAANTSHIGVMTINLSGTSNRWIASHTGRNTTASTTSGGGSKTTASTVDRLVLVSANGSDTFDAGDVTLVWD